ncbi:MAG: RidA family protein [Alphaproteobacteria bacterium]
MGRQLISSGSVFEEMAGYSRAVADGDWVFVSGTVGVDFATGKIADNVGEQTEQALRTIATALTEADASLSDIVRVRVYLKDRADVGDMCRVLKETFGDIRPTNTTIFCDFADEAMKVEIEVVALRRR